VATTGSITVVARSIRITISNRKRPVVAIALDHSPNCHIICGAILLVQFSAANVSVGSKADKIRYPYHFCFALHSDHIADIA
jgi:hypothetical protein